MLIENGTAYHQMVEATTQIKLHEAQQACKGRVYQPNRRGTSRKVARFPGRLLNALIRMARKQPERAKLLDHPAHAADKAVA